MERWDEEGEEFHPAGLKGRFPLEQGVYSIPVAIFKANDILVLYIKLTKDVYR